MEGGWGEGDAARAAALLGGGQRRCCGMVRFWEHPVEGKASSGGAQQRGGVRVAAASGRYCS